MNAKAEVEKSGLDIVKLILAIGVVVAGIVGFYLFGEQPLWMRLLGLLVLVAVATAIAAQTAIGRSTKQFISGANTEVRKVVWPTRQETLQTSLVIFVAVLVMALFLWGVDSLLFSLVRNLTGQGG